MTWLGESNQEGYDVAQVCHNGHVANSSTISSPQFNQDFCDKCGEKTITECPHCHESIRGHYVGTYVIGGEYHPPPHCHNCGKPFPWTERRIQAAIELSVEAGGLTGDDAKQLKESVNEIVRDTPKTHLAATRLKRLLPKLGQGTANAVRDILVDIASETAKRIIWPGG